MALTAEQVELLKKKGAISKKQAAELAPVVIEDTPEPTTIDPIVMEATPSPKPNPYGYAANMVGLPTSPPSLSAGGQGLPIAPNQNDALAMNAVMAKQGGAQPMPPPPMPSQLPPPPNPMGNQLAALGVPAGPPPPKTIATDTLLDPAVNLPGGNPNAPAKPVMAPIVMTAKPPPPKPMGGVGGGPPLGMGAPPGPPKSLADRMYLPAEREQQKATIDYLLKTGKIDAAQAEAMAQGEFSKSVLMKNFAEQAEIDEAERQQNEAKRAAYVKSALDEQQAQVQALSEEKIDPGRFWAEKDTGSKILAGIGMILGGLGAGLQKQGGNPVLDQLERAVNRDVDAQKANIGNKYSALAAQKGIFAERLQSFGDERMAEASAKASYWDQIKLQLEGIAATSSSEVTKLNAQKASEEASFKVASYTNQIQIGAEQKYGQIQAAQKKAIDERNKMLVQKNVDLLSKLGEEYAKPANGGIQTYVTLIKSVPGQPKDPNEGMPVLVDMSGKPLASMPTGTVGGGGASVYTGTNAQGEPMFNGSASPKSKTGIKAYNTKIQEIADADKLFAELAKIHERTGTSINPWNEDKERAKVVAEKLGKLGYVVPDDITGIGDKWSKVEAEWGDLKKKQQIAEQVYLSNGPKPLSLGKPVDDTGAEDRADE